MNLSGQADLDLMFNSAFAPGSPLDVQDSFLAPSVVVSACQTYLKYLKRQLFFSYNGTLMSGGSWSEPQSVC